MGLASRVLQVIGGELGKRGHRSLSAHVAGCRPGVLVGGAAAQKESHLRSVSGSFPFCLGMKRKTGGRVGPSPWVRTSFGGSGY